MLTRAGAAALTLCSLGSAAWAQTTTPPVAPVTVPVCTLKTGATTPESAAALQQQVTDWLNTTLGPNIKIAKLPVQITPAGDHFVVSAPLGDAPDAPVMTSNATQCEDGRWTMDTFHLPSPATFHFTPPQSANTADAAKVGTITSTITVGQQDGKAVFDPTFATPSTSTSTLSDMTIKTTSESGLEQQSTIGHGTGNAVLQPVGGDRVDFLVDSTLDGYSIVSKPPGQTTPFTIGMGKVRATGNLNGISRDKVMQVTHMVADIVSKVKTEAAGAKTPEQRAADRAAGLALLQAAAGLTTGGSFLETIDDLSLDADGMRGVLHALRIGLAIKGDGGMLSANLDLGAEGLTLPELGLGSMVELIPTKMTLKPSVSGLPGDAVMSIAQTGIDEKDPTPQQIMALFGPNGITAGLDDVRIESAGTVITGSGKMVFTSPQVFTGSGTLTAENLDALQQKIAAEPQLAQAAPVIIFLKGIARNEGGKLVWDIAYRNGHAFVNNQDLTALAGGGGGGAQPAPAPRPRPQQATPPAPTGPAPAPILRPQHPRQ